MSDSTRRLLVATAIPVLAFGFAACGSDEEAGGDGGEQEAAHQALLASYSGLEAEPYTMESSMTIDDVDFMNMTSVFDGASAHASQELYMSAIMEAMGEELEADADPETAEMMQALFSDAYSEAIVIDDVLYMQLSGGVFDTVTEEFGDDAWFTLDLAEDGEIGDVYRQFGSFDLAEQTELMLNDLSEVDQTAEGVYTGTLSPDSEAMQSLLGATGGAANGVEFVEDTVLTITVDDDERLQTIEMTLPEIEGMTMHMVSEVVEVGGDYDVSAPESDNLHSFDEVAALGQ